MKYQDTTLGPDNSPYQICTKTVMDTSDPNIVFDQEGISQYWHQYQKFVSSLEQDPNTRQAKLENIIHKLRQEGKNKAYDCVIGVSGGIDSTYVAYLVKEWGLRPLAVHFDGGWDNDFGRHNMQVLKEGLDIEVHDLKVPFEQIRDLLLAYLKASVVDIGIYADHAILATMYNLAQQHSITTILLGTNYRTEFISPKAWVYNKIDLINLRSIHQQFGALPALPDYPTYGFFKQLRFHLFAKLRTINILDYVAFDSEEVESLLRQKIDWKPYPRKHGESVFTTFLQNYILPTKFGVDKRRMHLSSRICSGEISRAEALENLKKPLYTPEAFQNDLKQVLDKLQISQSELEELLARPIKSHYDYRTDRKLRDFYMKLMRLTASPRAKVKKTFFRTSVKTIL